MTTSFASLIRQRPAPIGTIISTDSVEIADLLAGCGFDWLFLDAEHGVLTLDGVPQVLSVVQGRVPALVRVPDHQEASIKKVLDAGADGIIVPQVNSAQIAAQIVAMAKYPPLGSRSVGVGRAHRYGHRFSDYLRTANELTSVILQIEDRDAVDNIEEIIAIDGIDGVCIGPYDLSGSLGCVGDIANSMVQDAIATIRAACAHMGMPVGIPGLTAEAGRSFVEADYDFMTVGIDLSLLDMAARQLLGVVRAG
ncbi:MAG: HpcH/HpaI aldolase family protein [Candidatus Dormibacteraceae bacterium]